MRAILSCPMVDLASDPTPLKHQKFQLISFKLLCDDKWSWWAIKGGNGGVKSQIQHKAEWQKNTKGTGFVLIATNSVAFDEKTFYRRKHCVTIMSRPFCSDYYVMISWSAIGGSVSRLVGWSHWLSLIISIAVVDKNLSKFSNKTFNWYHNW